MKLDPHIHSSYSGDARSTPKEIIERAKLIGLDIIALSDHNTVKGSKVAIELSKNLDDLLVVPSIEISSSEGHILGFGIESAIPRDLSPEETVERVHDEGGIAIIPHPFSSYRRGLFFNNKKTMEKTIKKKIRGVEVLNARCIIGYSNHESNKLADKHSLAKIGSSDSHFVEAVGNCYTEIEIDNEPSVHDVIQAIKSRKAKVRGKRTSNYLIAREVVNKKIRRIY
ncbi:hypothetical protein ALNOE001_12920 [Candidatus Methanobinarius endosymbioticus]|uniref:Polymerase/histidinol phosphatase N-terminal domain-containing protein n=1 Tax=Candidatus Methanobinarius endosymbioticus TaxID=2006182 RepID=A0A366MBY8_9EURY|nr:hypothetical protein ALNOE001_12920 [Candidatus Methanobinarius endosymbioticus]